MKKYLGQKIILASMENGEINGCYLEKISQGIAFAEMQKKEVDKLTSFPNIVSLLQDGALLQIYQEGLNFCSEIGYIYYEGPYGEEEYFEVHYSAQDEDRLLALEKLNSLMSGKQQSQKSMLYKKVYRTYGQVGYR